MRSIKRDLSFPPDWLYGKDFEDIMFRRITSDYMFRCDNYAVAYQFLMLLDKLRMCEHSDITDECFWPYSWIIFITCRPQDIVRMKYVAQRIPSSIPTNIKIYDEEENEV